MNVRKYCIIALLLFVSFLVNSWNKIERSLQAGKDWPFYGGNKAGNRYSPLNQVNLENVKDLKVAWMYDAAVTKKGDIQCQPIVVDGVLSRLPL